MCDGEKPVTEFPGLSMGLWGRCLILQIGVIVLGYRMHQICLSSFCSIRIYFSRSHGSWLSVDDGYVKVR